MLGWQSSEIHANGSRGGVVVRRFVLIGAAGYVAPRHMAAIKAVGGQLVAIHDPHDSVGVIDRYFPECLYFREFARLDRFVDRAFRNNNPIHYVVICTPNYLHDCYARWALRHGADVIVEKPVVLSERNLDALLELEKDTLHRVYPIYQMRLHASAADLLSFCSGKSGVEVDVDYCVPRGPWYHYSWKGDPELSGGLPANIGCHLFDLCACAFGQMKLSSIYGTATRETVTGTLVLERAVVRWRLSVELDEPRRIFRIGQRQFDFTTGFETLHELAYKKIMEDSFLTLEDVRESVRIIEALR